MYNINEGRNPELMERCEILSQYSRFVSAVREAARKGEITDPELKQLFQQCIDQGILPDFLKEYGTEGINMLFEELTQEEAVEMARDGGMRIGIKKGYKQGAAEMQERINRLNNALIQAKRFEDLEKATTDENFQQQLFEEFGL